MGTIKTTRKLYNAIGNLRKTLPKADGPTRGDNYNLTKPWEHHKKNDPESRWTTRGAIKTIRKLYKTIRTQYENDPET